MAIKQPWAATRTQVKTFLQIADASYDTLIDTYLPIVSKDVELITNQSFVVELSGDFTDTSAVIAGIKSMFIDFGHVVNAAEMAQAAIIDFDTDAETITTDVNATATASGSEVYVNLFPVAKKPIVAQMVWHLINQYGKDSKLSIGYTSERFGNYSYTRADGEAGTVAGYPASIVKALAEITRVRFY